MTARCALDLYMGALKIFESRWVRPRLVFPIVAATGRSDDRPVYTLCRLMYNAESTHLIRTLFGHATVGIMPYCTSMTCACHYYEQPKRRAADQNLLCYTCSLRVTSSSHDISCTLFTWARSCHVYTLCAFAIPFSLVVYSTFSEWDFNSRPNMQAYCWTPIMKWTWSRWR